MSQLDILGRHISQKIKRRGREYFESSAVEILYTDPDFVSAQVAGTQDYAVDLERERASLIYSCECPYFEENFEVCKHIWATLLELEHRGHFAAWKSRFPVEMIPTAPDGNFDDPDLEDLDFEHESAPYGGSEKERRIRAERHSEPPVAPTWRHHLKAMSLRLNYRPESDGWPAGREILYILDIGNKMADRTLAIQVSARERKKNGGWKKCKPLSLSYELLPLLPDAADREILTRLMGVKRETWYHGSYESVSRFQPGGHDLHGLLPMIARTGRLCFQTPEQDEMVFLDWDDGGCWEFRMDAIPDERGQQYEICGAFYRVSQRIPIAQLEYVSPVGVFIRGSSVAVFNGTADWIEFFRSEGPFFVPRDEADTWLEALFALRNIPGMNLPPELRIEETEADPSPVLHVNTKKEIWNRSLLVGELHFDYLGHIIEENDPAPGIALVSQRRRIVRNPQMENLAREKLKEVGFRSESDYQGKQSWTISPARLPAAVRHLTSAGWKVDAEGKLFRTSGTFRLQLSSGIDWFELHGSAEFGDSRVPLPRLLTALKRRENTILLDDGSVGILPEEWLQKYGMLAGLGTAKGDRVRFRRTQAGLLDALLASQPEVRCDEVFEKVRRDLHSFTGVTAAEAPSGFNGMLRPYQKKGLGWLHFLQQFGFGGCLADDMGLGKTIQVLSLLEERRSLRTAAEPAGSVPASLVVMPRSLIFNWSKEAERFTPKLRILEHTGVERVRSHEHFDDYDAIFTTYGTLRRDASFFKDKWFDYIILDEAQAIKNASTESAKAARLLRGAHRLALSGTPIENHLGELWSLFEFLNPGMLGSASVFGLGKASAARPEEECRSLLSQALRPFILRRTKAQVAPELPSKFEQILFCELEPPQRALYNELRDHYRNTLLHGVERRGIQNSKMHILEALLRLRQAAIHPGLIDRRYVHDDSAKLDMLLPQLIEVLEENHKALVFSQFTSMLGILRQKLDQEKIRYEYLDGKTKDRQLPVERFQNDPESGLFLISLKAGGLGLNLTAAEYVYILDPWWNPFVEAQAIDRTHRIGQTRSIFAYRLIAKETVEERVLELQGAKKEIADAIINQDNSLLRNLAPEDLEILLS